MRLEDGMNAKTPRRQGRKEKIKMQQAEGFVSLICL
jgi:hypothetical protein